MQRMTASRASFHLAWALAWMAGLAAATVLAAKAPPPLELSHGARVGLITVLDAEVTHFHAAAKLMDSSLKSQPVPWRVDLMLGQALQGPLADLGLTGVSLPPGEALSGLREECFLNANLAKPLSKACAAPYAALATAQHLDAIIVLGPGLNNSAHADGTRNKELPDYLRGWCVLTDGRMPGSTPTLLNLTEMLIIANTPAGAVLAAREWGGASTSGAANFTALPDPKQLGDAQLEQLQPLFAAMLRAQAGRLLGQVRVAR
jgi:hypothetical protein